MSWNFFSCRMPALPKQHLSLPLWKAVLLQLWQSTLLRPCLWQSLCPILYFLDVYAQLYPPFLQAETSSFKAPTSFGETEALIPNPLLLSTTIAVWFPVKKGIYMYFNWLVYAGSSTISLVPSFDLSVHICFHRPNSSDCAGWLWLVSSNFQLHPPDFVFLLGVEKGKAISCFVLFSVRAWGDIWGRRTQDPCHNSDTKQCFSSCFPNRELLFQALTGFSFVSVCVWICCFHSDNNLVVISLRWLIKK